MKNGKTFFVECKSSLGKKYYFGGPDHRDLIKYITTKTVIMSNYKDISLEYLKNIYKGRSIKNYIIKAKDGITWIRS